MPFKFASTLVLSFVCLLSVWVCSADQGRGERLTLKTAEGTTFPAYRTGPPGARIGILLIHDSWGLDASVREWADWLGNNGYRVIAPDLYEGKVAASATEAASLSAGLKQAGVNAKYRAAMLSLKAPGRKQVAMGWSFGGVQAFQAALSLPNDVQAVVSYEGLPADLNMLNATKGAVLAMYARKDGSVTAEKVRSLEAAMKRLKRPLVVAYYDSKRLESADRYYSGESARLVWKDTQAFFKKHVK